MADEDSIPDGYVQMHHPVSKQDATVTREAFEAAWKDRGWELAPGTKKGS